MFENVCSLPQVADVFCLAVHPAEPLFAVGLASGHVECFRLPHDRDRVRVNGKTNGSWRQRPTATAVTSANGPINTVSTVWRTRRHRGSCRALAWSTDGSTLYSAGGDDVVKVADGATGRVVAKVAVPAEQRPSALLALSAQSLVLGTDGGAVHIYSLSPADSSRLGRTHLVPAARPTKTLYPHRNEAHPDNSEAIVTLSPLPPSATSTSLASRSFVSAAGSTLAVTDVHKGVVACSIDQGDILLSAVCVPLAPPAGNAPSKKRKAPGRPEETQNPNDKVLLGCSEGTMSLWTRGEWDDGKSRVPIGKTGVPSIFGLDDAASIDALAVQPLSADEKLSNTRLAAVGLGSGLVKLVTVSTGRGAGFVKETGQVSHDERGVDGVAAIGWEAGGARFMTGGGELVKVWSLKRAGDADSGIADDDSDLEEDASDDDAEEEDGEETFVNGEANGHQGEEGDDSDQDDGEDDDDDDDDSDDDDDDAFARQQQQQSRKSKKLKNGTQAAAGVHGHHGVRAFAGLD